MPSPVPVFVGFCVKRRTPSPDWLLQCGGNTSRVKEICSVSECVAERPLDWVNRWDFNRALCYASEAMALATIPEGETDQYALYAYRMFPLRFNKVEGMQEIDLLATFTYENSPLPAEPDLADFRWLGYDLVSYGFDSQFLGFGCSPLSCNGCAAQWDVNPYCLIDRLDEAIRAGDHFARTEPEPGPYLMFEVLRRRSPR